MGISFMEKNHDRAMKKIVLTGVESTGKTVLSQSIAGSYRCPLVQEYARTYLKDKGLDYKKADLVKILQGQFDLEAGLVQKNPELLVCDTGPLVIKVWSLFKYGTVDPKIANAVKSYKADLFIIPDPDGVPFEEDGLRENRESRDQLYQMYIDELIQLDIPFLVATGSFKERLHQVKDAVDAILS